MTTVVIVDDHDVIREVLKKHLTKYKIVGEAKDGDSALDLVKQTKPDMILLDLEMPKRSGLSIIPEIRQQGTRVLVVTIHESADYARQAFEAGADGYFLKDEGGLALNKAISQVLDGQKYVSPSLGDIGSGGG